MEITNSIPNFRVVVEPKFVNKAKAIKDKIIRTDIRPKEEIRLKKDGIYWESEYVGSVENTEKYNLGKNDSVCYDFGDHCVGYISFDISPVGSPPDAPALLRLKLGEKLIEIGEDSAEYNGLLSSSWIQEEYIHIDELPAHIELPRRYAFRYFEVLVKDTSPSYKVNISNVNCRTVSSGDINKVEKPDTDDEELIAIDKISVKTMMGCMQEVFEDGPKRDRRLWVGDLRLQALVNYETFKNYELVKKCLYLFAGLKQNAGSVAACIYTKSDYKPSDVYLFDYSLLFISCLYDYYTATGDIEFLRELYPIAKRQNEIASELLDENGLVKDSDKWWCFIDWNNNLNKQAGAQAIFIYTLKQLRELAEILENSEDEIYEYDKMIKKASDASVKYLWDEEQDFFISGKDRQVSWASQVWFVMAGVFDKEKNRELLKHLIAADPEIELVTPYAYHYFIQALTDCGMTEEAVKYIKLYWGGMLKDGADCFYEFYNPKEKQLSPYGSKVIDSYCHAWSGTPSYFIRHYFGKNSGESGKKGEVKCQI